MSYGMSYVVVVVIGCNPVLVAGGYSRKEVASWHCRVVGDACPPRPDSERICTGKAMALASI